MIWFRHALTQSEFDEHTSELWVQLLGLHKIGQFRAVIVRYPH